MGSSSENELDVTESIDISKKLSDDDLAILDSIDISKEVDAHALSGLDFLDSSEQTSEGVESLFRTGRWQHRETWNLIYKCFNAIATYR